jgi:hypothetical protein
MPLRSWTKEDDELLLAAVMENGQGEWGHILSRMSAHGFTEEECQSRWDILRPGPNKVSLYIALRVFTYFPYKGPWTRDEDILLEKLVKRFGPKKWSVIAGHVPGRKGKQCRCFSHSSVCFMS